MNNLSIHSYKKEDYHFVKEILVEGELFVETWDQEEKLEKRIKEKSDSILIAVIGEKVIGCVFLVDDIFPFIFHLAVKKEFRKRGIGKLLIQAAIKKLKINGHEEIALFALDSNEELKKWYRKQGFKEARLWRFMWKEI